LSHVSANLIAFQFLQVLPSMLGRLAYRSFTQQKMPVSQAVRKCGALDLEKIEKELKAKGL
jgi:hypothetical protein